jgi:hypothetical protein
VVYTLSSPTVLAGDAACHPNAAEVLDVLSAAFRLTRSGVARLGMHALETTDPAATALAWGMVELVDAAAPSTSRTLRSVASGGLLATETLARARFGDVRDVTRLVLAEVAGRPGTSGGADPLGAGRAAAAAVVAARWTQPDLPPEHVDVLAAPWLAMAAESTENSKNSEEPYASYGPQGSAVAELRTTVANGRLSITDLADIAWPAGVWAQAMHAGAWAAHTTGRLHAQMVAVLDVTAALLRSNADADPAQVRHALPALHALTVAAVVGDILDAAPLTELRLGGVVL